MRIMEHAKTALKASTAQTASIFTLVLQALTLPPQLSSASSAQQESNAQPPLSQAREVAELESTRSRAKPPALLVKPDSSVLIRTNLSSHVLQEHTVQALLLCAPIAQPDRSAQAAQIKVVCQCRVVTLASTLKTDGLSASLVHPDTSAKVETRTRSSAVAMNTLRPEAPPVSM